MLTIIFAGCVKPKITCEIIQPQPNAIIELGETINLAVIAETENTSVSEVQIYLDEVGYEKKYFFPFNFSIPTSHLEQGAHTIRAVAIANSEVKTESSVTFNLVQYESPDSVSFSNGQFPLGWKNDRWFLTSPGYNDSYAIGASSYNYSATVSTTKTCNASINYIEFYAKSSYWNNTLYFYIDDLRFTVELTESWKKYSYPVAAQGKHIFSWLAYPYSNEGMIFLDDIKFYKE